MGLEWAPHRFMTDGVFTIYANTKIRELDIRGLGICVKYEVYCSVPSIQFWNLSRTAS